MNQICPLCTVSGHSSLSKHEQIPGHAVYALIRHQTSKGAWYWGVHFSRRGQMVYQNFHDTKYGGNALARKAAVAWRDTQMAQVPALSMVEFCAQKRSHNTSGVAGVHFLTSPRQPLGYWQAKLKLDGKGKYKSFSVLKHGWHSAYEQAVAARLQMLAEAQDRPYLYDKVAKRMAPTPEAASRNLKRKVPPVLTGRAQVAIKT